MADKVLFVDDDQNILSGFHRYMHDRYAISTAESGQKGLDLLKTEGPFSVVVSDYKMPGMSGAQFLEHVRTEFPDTVRIMLSVQRRVVFNDSIEYIADVSMDKKALNASATLDINLNKGDIVILSLEPKTKLQSETLLSLLAGVPVSRPDISIAGMVR